MADELNELARRIAEVAGDKSVSAFAKECGFGESLLRKYLAGSLPNASNLVAIARAGGVTVDWLATGRPPKMRAVEHALDQAGPKRESFDGRRDMLEAVLRVAEYKISRGEVTRQVIETSLRGAPVWLDAAREYPDLEPRFRTMIATMEFMNAAGEGALDAERRE